MLGMENYVNDPALTATSPRRIRQSNEVAALRALHQFGRLSRAELARKLRLNRSSSGHIIASLTADGLVREASEDPPGQPGHARAGRPGIMIELVPDAIFFLGVEIGVEHISTVEIDLGTNIVSTNVEPFEGPSVSVEVAVDRAVRLALQSIPASKLERCEGLGVSTPAQMDKNGFVRLAPLLGWREVHLAELVRDALPIRVPVLAENDANAFAIGATYGRNEGRSGVTLFLVMESGIGGGIIIDGSLFRGANGLAGEIGHLLVSDAPGPRRNLEQLIGLESIMAEYRKTSASQPADIRQFPCRCPRPAAERRLDCRGMVKGTGGRPCAGLPHHRRRPDRAGRVGRRTLSTDGRQGGCAHPGHAGIQLPVPVDHDERPGHRWFRFRCGMYVAPALSVPGKPALLL